MANHLAIATITATLQRTLQSVIQTDVEGAQVTTVRPSDVGNGTPETGVNLFLYQVITNPALNNIDSTPMRSRGMLTKRQAAVDLYYMLSFYGNDTELAPQRLLGSVVRTLNDRCILTPEMIQAACADSTAAFLQDSNLADQIQQIHIAPLDLNLEDLSKAWSVFFQTPYLLSVGYKVLVVMMEGDEAPIRSLPIRDRRTSGLMPFGQQPKVQRVVAQGGLYTPILSDSVLVITGQQLKGDHSTLVRCGSVELLPTEVKPDQIRVSLEQARSQLRAGIQSLQVVHRTTSDQVRGVESNALPFVLRPRVLSVSVAPIVRPEDEGRSANLTIQLDVPVAPTQRVVVGLNEWSLTEPKAYLFDAMKQREVSDRITVTVEDIHSGEYLIRVLVDGAESQLEIDTDINSLTYDWYIGPRIVIS